MRDWFVIKLRSYKKYLNFVIAQTVLLVIDLDLALSIKWNGSAPCVKNISKHDYAEDVSSATYLTTEKHIKNA